MISSRLKENNVNIKKKKKCFYLYFCITRFSLSVRLGSGDSKSSINDGESQNKGQEDSAWPAQRGYKNLRKSFRRKTIKVCERLKNSNSKTQKTQIVTKLKNSNCDKTKKIKLWQNFKKIWLWPTQNFKLCQNWKTNIITNSKTEIVKKYFLKLRL